MIQLQAVQAKLDELKMQLDANNKAILRQTGLAADYEDFLDNAIVSRAGFVLPGSLSGKENALATQAVRQKVIRGFSILVAFASADMTTPKALNDVDPITFAVIDHLMGWMPEGETSPVQFASSRVAKFDDDAGLLVVQIDFYNNTYLRKAIST